MWDPETYRKFGEQRSRPFFELTARIGASAPEFVTDLGCGPGELTAELCARWPQADVLGVDNSAEMIAAAQSLLNAEVPEVPEVAGSAARLVQAGSVRAANAERGGRTWPRLRFELADVRDWQPGRPVDVLVSNALLQWVPDHEDLLIRWAGQLAPGGWLAFAVPANFGQPAHALMRELAATARWRRQLRAVEFNRQTADPAAYLDVLARAGCAVDAWETTYLHVLDGEDAVLRWYEGTGLRPVLAALDPGQAAAFTSEYGALLRDAYPRRPYGTVLPFRRVFAVARRPG
ncbi:MAG TPA: methyltransferase domain-containing protein [Streptosporangiaceae bacterium]